MLMLLRGNAFRIIEPLWWETTLRPYRWWRIQIVMWSLDIFFEAYLWFKTLRNLFYAIVVYAVDDNSYENLGEGIMARSLFSADVIVTSP